MDLLAWFVIAVFASVVGLPIIAVLVSSDPFIEYKEAWLLGHGLTLLLALFGVCLFGLMWAFDRVIS